MRQVDFVSDYAMIDESKLESYSKILKDAHNMLHNKNGRGNDYLGWLDYPSRLGDDLLEDIVKTALEIKDMAEVLIVIGIGGSYLGAKCVIEALTHSFNNILSKEDRNSPLILFAGNNLSGKYLNDLLDIIKDKDFAINVISKSGTTTEPAISFRILKEKIEERYGRDGAKERIIVTTDSINGALVELSHKEGYKTFIIPSDIGGRYSVFTPVGLLPIASAGLDIMELIKGAREGSVEYMSLDYKENPCYHYALCRSLLYNEGKVIEILVNYEPSLSYIAEWWKQLFGESEGKEGKGLFPASVSFTSDLHSMGQYIQEGHRHLFETIIDIRDSQEGVIIPYKKDDLDNLNYLSGKSINYVNKMAQKGTIMAHNRGNVPNLILSIECLSEKTVGKLLYFLEKACGISGYMQGINPFNQPGVEEYKKNMFILLEKPGYKSNTIANQET